MSKLHSIIPVLTIVFLSHCANPVTPTGGAKDVNPPKLILINPTDKSVNTRPTSIIFKFDEYIQTSNLKEQIVISPKINVKPVITVGKDNITIKIPGTSLKDNTTYSLQLNESIKDLNEGNVGLYEPFLFSTGDNVDTLSINGSCFFIEEPKSKKVKIQSLYAPFYRSITHKNLQFSMHGLPSDSIDILAYNDLNGNDSFEINEDAGLVKVKPGDTAKLTIYSVQKKKLNLYQFDKTLFGLHGINRLDQHQSFINFNDTLIGDSSQIFGILNKLDSIQYNIPKKAERLKYHFRYKLIKPAFLIDSFQQLVITANAFIKTTTNKYFIYSNSQNLIDSGQININGNKALFIFKNNHTGNIRLPINLIAETGKEIKDTLKVSIPVYTPITIHNNESFNIYITIKNKVSGETYQCNMEANQQVTLWVQPTDHEVTYFHDANRNGLLDGPKLNVALPGEFYKKLPTLKIKENMAVDLYVKDTEKP